MEEGKGNSSERRRGLLEKAVSMVLGETLPVTEGERSVCCRQDQAVEIQEEGRVEAAGEETQGTQFRHWVGSSSPSPFRRSLIGKHF